MLHFQRRETVLWDRRFAHLTCLQLMQHSKALLGIKRHRQVPGSNIDRNINIIQSAERLPHGNFHIPIKPKIY